MPCICYVEKRFKPGTLQIIEHANNILSEYTIDLTLRQLYYQFVSRGLLANKQSSYDNLGSIINDARLAGLIDWDRIQDLTRELRGNNFWDDPSEILRAVSRQYKLDRWVDQPNRPEVWVEKDALRTVIANACEPHGVPYFSCRGYVSQSEMHVAAQRFNAYYESGQYPIIFHLGDHDPSGIDMTRDIRARLRVFGVDVDVRRIALTMDQIDEYQPPPNPAKTTDARFANYALEYGEESWELDALDPTTLTALIDASLVGIRDDDLYNARMDEENRDKRLLRLTYENWDELAPEIEEKYDTEDEDDNGE